MKKRMLFLTVSPSYYPDSLAVRQKFRLLSQRYCGDIFAILGNKKYLGTQVSDFRVRGLSLTRRIRYNALLRDIIYAVATVTRAVYLHYARHRYDVIVAPEPLVCGVIALVLGRVTRAKVVIEVNGQYAAAFNFGGATPSLKDKLKQRYVNVMVPFVLQRADAVKLLYPGQVGEFVDAQRLKRVACFSNYVPVHEFRPGVGSMKYVLFVGYPWILKGVDILIPAFNRITEEFPDWSLRIVGYCEDRTPFVELANGNPRIVFFDPVSSAEVVKLMSECSMFVLPSRTEAMGRVLLEAMASKKPIVASNVDGIPFVVTHEKTGLLFESGNVTELAAVMKRLMADPVYADRLAEQGYQRVHDELSEDRYFENFTHFIEQVTAES